MTLLPGVSLVTLLALSLRLSLRVQANEVIFRAVYKPRGEMLPNT